MENINLQREALSISNINGLITYQNLSPLEPENIDLTIEEIMLDEAITQAEASLTYTKNGFELTSLTGIWNSNQVDLGIELQENPSTPPNLNIKNIYQNISDIRDLLKLDIEFSAPMEFSKTWRFNGTSYESNDLNFINNEPGILTLNEKIPELSNIYVQNMRLQLESDETAVLTVKGRHPLLYGQKPVKIETKLQRYVE